MAKGTNRRECIQNLSVFSRRATATRQAGWTPARTPTSSRLSWAQLVAARSDSDGSTLARVLQGRERRGLDGAGGV
ncbi:hypothetical protein E2562_019375 [Oryza meyeriana var. granulata]|uniref:Uncharacterized protein n=1 Tax=Oryza meyeriana var. granulata TaxID=110450 RepID=A0A6G1BLT0_9ORYZ|nr:hypothetical protein E2562_019375 [Oryza meyeriana var. granulata]